MIDWNKPAENGQTILGYHIYIKQNDGVFSESLATCDGSDFTIIVQTACTVTVQTLQAEPYNLPSGASVLAKVIAYNSIGDSLESAVGDGAILVLSLVPDAPILQKNVGSSTKTQIGVKWTDGVYNGG